MTQAPKSTQLTLTLKQGGVPCSMTFTEVSCDWWISDCKRYSISVVHAPGCAKPYLAWVRASHDAIDKDGTRPMAESLDAFENINGRDSAIAACIRHKRAHPIQTTTTQPNAAA